MAHDPTIQIPVERDWSSKVGFVIAEHRTSCDAGSWPCTVGHNHTGRRTIAINHKLLLACANGITSIFEVNDLAASVADDSAGISAIPDSASNCPSPSTRSCNRSG